jgi:hypothetical protein
MLSFGIFGFKFFRPFVFCHVIFHVYNRLTSMRHTQLAGDGWNGIILYIDNQTFTLSTGSYETAIACLVPGTTYTPYACGDSWSSEEVYWWVGGISGGASSTCSGSGGSYSYSYASDSFTATWSPSPAPTITAAPTVSFQPTMLPTLPPTLKPTAVPTVSFEPTAKPTPAPSVLPTMSAAPTTTPVPTTVLPCVDYTVIMYDVSTRRYFAYSSVYYFNCKIVFH